jgi:ABC-type uncharacterized transport system involved in gliding motility auxiliary subunit
MNSPTRNGPTRNGLGAGMLVLLGVAFVAAVVLSQHLLKGARIDLTEHRLYTLSPGTRALLARLEEPITLTFFFSERATRDYPGLRTYGRRVRELLEEMAAASGGAMRLQVLDPVPFSEAEDRATAVGLRGASIGPLGEAVYFGLAGSNALGDEALVAFFDPDQEAFLEYELARLVMTLMSERKPVIGLLAGLPVEGGFDPMSRQMTRPWVVVEQARQLFEVRTLPVDTVRIDTDIDVLWMLHPKNLDDSTVYAIDQFMLRGGRALVLVDPLSQLDQPDPWDPGGGMEHDAASSLAPLLSAWGVRVPDDELVLDDVAALSVGGLGQRPQRHLGLIGIRRDGLSNAQVMTAGLDQINFAFSGHILTDDDSPLRMEPLITSSEQAGLIGAFDARINPDPEALRERFEPVGRFVLAAQLTGNVPSAFADGPPPNLAEYGDDEADEAPLEHLAASQGPISLLLVADTDMASDRMWVQVQNFLGQPLPSAFASNGDFLINALDYLGGSTELLGLRGRAPYRRPFTRVEQLRREADTRVSETLASVEAELRETELRLATLQAAREDAGSLLLSPAQEAEIERFRQRQVQLRQDLRTVQREREASIQALGTRLKIINIGLVPLLLTVVGLLGLALRRRRRTAA